MNQRAAFLATVQLADQQGMPELPGSDLGLAHMRDMLARITGTFSEAKLGRWLGWAQCALVAADVGVTLEDVKALNLRYAIADPEPEITDENAGLVSELHGVTAVFGDMSPIGNLARRAAAALAPQEPAQVTLVTSGRQSGKTAQMIDALLDRANERGIAVKVIEPKAELSDAVLIDLWWKTCSDEWAIPEHLMIAFGRAAIEAARQ